MLKEFKNPGILYQPELRWWLAEGYHTDQTLTESIHWMAENGFGGTEFLARDADGADSSLYGWGSEEWVHDSQLIIKTAAQLGMAVSTTSGTNWSTANLTTITPDDKAAAKELDYTCETLSPGQTRSGPIPKCRNLQPYVTQQVLIAAVAGRRTGKTNGKSVLLDKDSLMVLETENEELTFTAPEDGEYELVYFWMHGTGQVSTPSVGRSVTVNYMDRYGIDALTDYWDEHVLTDELRDIIRKSGRVQMYMDSLELSTYGKGGQFWGYTVLEEFKARRGYDLTPYLPFIIKEGGPFNPVWIYWYECEDAEFLRRLKNDLYQTFTDLYMDNMMKPMQDWLHSVGMTLRSEISYGLPFEISQPAKYVDGVETETLEFACQPDSYRGLSGGAHIYGTLFSSETGALMGLNYKLSMDFITQMCYTQFAAGVNRTVFHGYACVPGPDQGTQWPGHEGMSPSISLRLSERQPASIHYPQWCRMLERIQYMMRRGEPLVDIGILRTDYNYNNMLMGMAEDSTEVYGTKHLREHQAFYWKDMSLQDAGYTYEYLAPQLLEEDFIHLDDGLCGASGPHYKAIIVYQTELSAKSAQALLSLAQQGLPVLLVNGCTEMVRNGVFVTHEKAASKTPFNVDGDLDAVMAKLKALPNVAVVEDQISTVETLKAMSILPRAGFEVPNAKILACTRRDGDDTIAFVYNYMYLDTEPFTFQLMMEGEGTPIRANAITGEAEEVEFATESGKTVIPMTLNPGEAAIIVLSQDKTETKALMGQPKQVISLEKWDISVESWDAGEKLLRVEERNPGIVSTEAVWQTKKTPITVADRTLKPWNQYPEVGQQVSGIGYYTTEFTLPESYDRVELYVQSTLGGSAEAAVNGGEPQLLDNFRRTMDITSMTVPGSNSITIDVASSLCNRVTARGFYAAMQRKVPAEVAAQMEADGIPMPKPYEDVYQDHGLVGKVEIRVY